MKIAYLFGMKNQGGAETLMLDIFRNANKQGINAIGVYRQTGIMEQNFIQSGVPINQLSFKKNGLSYLSDLRKLLVKSEICIVHAQQPIDAFFAWIACLGTGIKIILTLHGYDYNDSGLSKKILSFIVKRTDDNIYVSKTQKSYYQNKYRLNPNKQNVVYNGISFDKFLNTRSATLSRTSSRDKSQAMNNIRDELNLSPDTLLLGSVGNFLPVRDQYSICVFLKRLLELKLNFHFVFVGKRGDSAPHLFDNCVTYCDQNGLNDFVSFLGLRNDIPEILSQLSAFVYATDHDTFGIAVVEAMAMGIPVFVNDWDVMKEITNEGEFATLYKTKDIPDLLRHFILFLHDKNKYEAQAAQAALFVRERYSIEKHIEELKEVYKCYENK